MISVSVTNLSQMRARLNRNALAVAGAFLGAVYLWACEVITRAMRLTPVATGYLRKSRYVTKPQLSLGQFEIEMGFSAPYAFAVENTERKHRVGQAHFMATALTQAAAAPSAIEKNTLRLLRAGTTIDGIGDLQPGLMAGPAPLRLLAARRRAQHRRRTAKARAAASPRRRKAP